MSLNGGNMGGGGGGPQPPLAGGPGGRPEPTQFTEEELAVMKGIKSSVAVARRIGIIVGLGVGYALAARRKPPVSLGTRIAFPLIGSFTGGALSMPLGVMYGQRYMGQVEDEEHFKRAVITAVEAKRAGAPSPLTAPKRQPQQQGEVGYPTLPNSDSMTSRSQSQQQKEVAWADDGFDPSALYQNNENRDPSQQAGYSTPYASTSSPTGSANEQQPQQQDQQPSSRWAQVRGERGPAPSSWDRIRQQNAQQASQQRSAPASGADGYGGSASSAGAPMADPTFGKGVSSSRAQSQREYEASFERERRGVDR